MAQKATCPKCNARIVIRDEFMDETGKLMCQSCGGAFRLKNKPASILPSEGRKTVGGDESLPEQLMQSRSIPSSNELVLGSRFAERFTIVRELGSGTFGRVYHAFDTKEHRDVALKVPGDDILWNNHVRNRFRAEAEILQRLLHPSIVTFYEAQFESHPRYLVSELIHGRDLERELLEARKAARPIDRGRAVTIVHQLAGALHHAHLRKIIHRDVKPGNILTAAGLVKLTDFGLARFGDPNLTSAGARIGTPCYMSPEQVSGETERIDGRTDQYSLGVVLFELLTNKVPFGGKTSESIYLKILTERLPSLSKLDPTIPKGLASVCNRALARNPEDRWPDCAAFGAALAAWLPVAAEPIQTEMEPISREPSDRFISEPTARGSRIASGSIKAISQEVAGRARRTIDKGRATLDPLVETVQPLGSSLKTAAVLSSRTIASRFPHWMSGAVALLTAWVDALNDRLRTIDPASISGSGSDLGSDMKSNRSVSHEADHRRQSSAEPVSLASYGGSVAAPSLTSRPAPSLPEANPRVREALQSLEASHKAMLRHHDDEAARFLERVPADLRGWEWAYLEALRRSPILTLNRPDIIHDFADVSALAFDSDGKTLACALGSDVELWETSTGRLLNSSLAGRHEVNSLAFSADGNRLAAAGGKAVWFWELETVTAQAVSHSLPGHDAMVTRIAFASDGIHLASASVDRTVRIWNLNEKIQRSALIGPASPAHALAFHPRDPSLLIVAHGDGTIVIWDWLQCQEKQRATSLSAAPIDDLALHPAGRIGVTGGRDGALTFWDLALLNPIATIPGEAGPITSVAFHPNGRWLGWLGRQKARSLQISSAHPVDLGRAVAAVPFATLPLRLLAFSPSQDGVLALAEGRHRPAKLWDGSSFWESLAQGRDGERAQVVAIDPTGTYWAVALADGSVEVHPLKGDRPLYAFPTRGVTIHALAFQPGASVLASADSDGAITFREITGAAPDSIVPAHAKGAVALAFDPEGRLFATSGLDGAIHLWNARTHAHLQSLSEDEDEGSTPLERLARIASGEEVSSASARVRVTSALAIADRGGSLRLYSAGSDPEIKVWDALSGELLTTLDGHKGKVVFLNVSENRLVSLSEDRVLIVWDLNTQEPLLTLRAVDLLANLAWHQPTGMFVAVGEDRSLILELSSIGIAS